MRIARVALKQFRGFADFELMLDPSLTVLVGANASGKTSVLAGLAVALGRWTAAIAAIPSGQPISVRDIRLVEHSLAGVPDLQPTNQTTAVTAEWMFGKKGFITITARGGAYKLPTVGVELHETARKLRIQVRDGRPVALPLVGYYGTARSWSGLKGLDARRVSTSRLGGYAAALEASASHRPLTEWMYRQTLVHLQEGRRPPQLACVERAVIASIPGATAFRFNVRHRRLELKTEAHGLVAFDNLSDGYRNMVALVADIARRAAVLNPQYKAGAAARTAGIVLIDEIELHLHPTWQRAVLGRLTQVFPKIQFVVTTHSPQVVASAKRGQVMILQEGGAVAAPFVEGRDSNSLLEDVFGEPYRPAPTKEDLKVLGRLIHDEKYSEARVMVTELEQRLGPDDPGLVRARFELDLETDDADSES